MLAFINGFEDQIPFGISGGGFWNGFVTSPTRSGGGSYRLANGSYQVNIPGGGDATIIVGHAYYYTSANVQLIADFRSDNGSTQHVTVYLNASTGVLTAYRGNSGGTVLGSATLSGPALLTSTWGYWEVKATLSSSAGIVVVRYNEQVVLNLSGLNTKNGGTKTVFDSIFCPNVQANQDSYFDDMYIVTGTVPTPTDFCGDCRVQTIYPNGNGDFSQLTNNTGNSTNNYSYVNETGAPNTATYVESFTAGQRDFYTMDDLATSPPQAVFGVQVTAWTDNPDVGNRSAKLGVRSGTSEALSAAQALTVGTFSAVRSMFTVDPATGAAWTVTGVNAAQTGFEVD